MDCAVVLSSPPGRDGRCAYRPLFLWAAELAARGYWVLRFDHRGEGDSLDVERDADQWAHWREGLLGAIAAVRDQSGATRVVLAGLRIGAALAAAAARTASVDGLILLAPVVTGASWLHELRVAAKLKGGALRADGVIEIDGLRLSQATVRALEQFETPPVPPLPAGVFLAGPPSVADRLRAVGSDVQATPFAGFAELFRDPHVNEPPAAVLDAATAWLEARFRPAPEVASPALAAAAELEDEDWTERRLTFGPGLRGVLCLPQGRRGSQGVIFGNTAADPRAGIGGFAARAARALARHGVVSLRFDFAGLGESSSPDDGPWRTHVYETSRVEDFRAAAAVLEREGCPDPVLAGVCTGGHHAVEAVAAGVGLRQAFAVNSWLVWRRGENLRSAEHLAAMRPDDHPLLGEVSQRLLPIRERVRRVQADPVSLARRWLALPPDDAARQARARIVRALGQGARIHLEFGAGDVSTRGLDRDFGPGGRWLLRQPGVTLSVTSGLDHALFSRASQGVAIRALLGFLGLQASPAPPPPVVEFGAQAPLQGLGDEGLAAPGL